MAQRIGVVGLVAVVAADALVDGLAALGAGGLDHLEDLVAVAQGVHGLGLKVVAAGALAFLLALLGAAGLDGEGPFAHVVAQGRGLVVGVAVTAAGAGVGGVAALGAGGLGDDGNVVVAQRLDHGLCDLLGQGLVGEVALMERAALVGAAVVGDSAGLGAGGGNRVNEFGAVDVDLADPEEAAVLVEVGPVRLAVGVEVDVDLAGMIGVHGVLGVKALGIPAGDLVVLHLDDLERLADGQVGVQLVLVFVVGVGPEDVSGLDAVHVPIGVGGEQIVAVVQHADVLAAQHGAAALTGDDQIIAAGLAEFGGDIALLRRFSGIVAQRIIFHLLAVLQVLAADGAVGDQLVDAALGAGGLLPLQVFLDGLAGDVAGGGDRLGLDLVADGALAGLHAVLGAGGFGGGLPLAPGVAGGGDLIGLGFQNCLAALAADHQIVRAGCGTGGLHAVLLGSGQLHMAQSLDGLGLGGVADGALAGLLAVLGAGGGRGDLPFAPVMARSLDHRGLGQVAAGAFTGLLAVLGAGGGRGDFPLAPVVAQSGLAVHLYGLVGQQAVVGGITGLGAGGLGDLCGIGGVDVAGGRGIDAVAAAGEEIVDHVVFSARVGDDVQIVGLDVAAVEDEHIIAVDVHVNEVIVVAVHIEAFGGQRRTGPAAVQFACAAPDIGIEGIAVGGVHHEDRDDLLVLLVAAVDADKLLVLAVLDGVVIAAGAGHFVLIVPDVVILEVVAGGRDDLGLNRVAVGAGPGLLAVGGAGGGGGDDPIAPVVAGGRINEIVLGELFGQILVGEDQAFQRTVGGVAVVVAQGAVLGAGGRNGFHIYDMVLVLHGGVIHQLVEGDGLLAGIGAGLEVAETLLAGVLVVAQDRGALGNDLGAAVGVDADGMRVGRIRAGQHTVCVGGPADVVTAGGLDAAFCRVDGEHGGQGGLVRGDAVGVGVKVNGDAVVHCVQRIQTAVEGQAAGLIDDQVVAVGEGLAVSDLLKVGVAEVGVGDKLGLGLEGIAVGGELGGVGDAVLAGLGDGLRGLGDPVQLVVAADDLRGAGAVIGGPSVAGLAPGVAEGLADGAVIGPVVQDADVMVGLRIGAVSLGVGVELPDLGVAGAGGGAVIVVQIEHGAAVGLVLGGQGKVAGLAAGGRDQETVAVIRNVQAVLVVVMGGGVVVLLVGDRVVTLVGEGRTVIPAAIHITGFAPGPDAELLLILGGLVDHVDVHEFVLGLGSVPGELENRDIGLTGKIRGETRILGVVLQITGMCGIRGMRYCGNAAAECYGPLRFGGVKVHVVAARCCGAGRKILSVRLELERAVLAGLNFKQQRTDGAKDVVADGGINGG